MAKTPALRGGLFATQIDATGSTTKAIEVHIAAWGEVQKFQFSGPNYDGQGFHLPGGDPNKGG